MRKILVIDDDEATLEVIKLLFEMNGFHVMDLFDCKSLPDSIDAFQPNIILMDVILGTVDGRDICRELKSSKHRKIPLILMSVVNGFHSDENMPLYSDDYIEKPFDLDTMLSKVNRLVTG